mgnify:CR=1 FL=1
MFTDETGLTVLIADDEEATREGLRSLLPWETLGVTEVVVASDGMEALDIISQRRPDVIISDIRMPRLDGISLARAAVAGGECALIFISGYSDKEFLKSAIELRAVRYVEKPISLTEMTKAVESAVRDIRRRRELQFFGDKRYLAERYALEAVRPSTDHSELAERIFGTLGLDFAGRARFMAVRALGESSCATLERAFSSPGSATLCAATEDGALLLLALERPESDSGCRKLIKSACESLRGNADNPGFYLAAGRPVERFSQLPESALSAEDALALRFYRGRNGCSFWSETPDAPQNAGYAAGFLSALAEKNGPKALRALEALEKRVGALCLSGRYPNIPELQGSCVDIADGIFEAADRAGISHEKLGPPPEAEASFSETLCALRGLAGRFFDEYQYAERSRPALTIMRCIDANFADSGFGISDVAKEVHLTISHICHIFKNETGKTVNEYLTRPRLRQAALLLAGVCVRVADVAEKVGYSDPN